ncbi:hypothetical protein MP638_003408 [Amoeboaphelidium occidentale]|nr:hypothetical protein MP638_003408 [Amoeboaphelidium occidentale]
MRNVDASYEYATSTIKVGLLKNVKPQDFLMKLKRYVERINLIRIHSSNLFNLYLIDMLAAGKIIGLVTTGKDGILCNFFVAGDLERKVNDYASMLKQVGLELPNGDGLSQSIVHLAGEYETRCKTFVSTTLLIRITRWLQFLLETALPEVFMSMARSKSAAGYLIAMLIYEMSDDPKKQEPTLAKKVVENCKKYSSIGLMGIALEQVYGGLRAFTLAHIYHNRNGYVNIDTSCLFEVYQFGKEDRRDWVFPFDKDLIEKEKTTQQYFMDTAEARWGETIEMKPWLRPDDFGFNRVNNKKVYVPIDLKDTVVIGLDPGRKDLFDAYDENGSFGCSGGEWRQLSGIEFSAKKRKFWLSKRTDIGKINADLPFSKVATVLEFKQYLSYFAEIFNTLMSFYGSHRWRLLRRKCDIHKQWAYDHLIKRIKRRGKKVFVAFGGGKFSSCSRGHAPIPKVGFYKALKQRNIPCRYVWEYNTSKICAKCFTVLPKGRKWLLKICSKITCGRYWNRDVNAAKNMKFVFTFMNNNNGENPEQFKPKQQKQEQNNNNKTEVTEGRKSAQDHNRGHVTNVTSDVDGVTVA